MIKIEKLRKTFKGNRKKDAETKLLELAYHESKCTIRPRPISLRPHVSMTISPPPPVHLPPLPSVSSQYYATYAKLRIKQYQGQIDLQMRQMWTKLQV